MTGRPVTSTRMFQNTLSFRDLLIMVKIGQYALGGFWYVGGGMRAIIGYFSLIAIFVWLASEGGFDRIGRGHLPIGNSRAPTHFSDLPLPDPHELNDLSVVPAAQAAGTFSADVVTVTATLVNLRAGPGLNYRMITVVQRGEQLRVNGATRGEWIPVMDMETGDEAWINEFYVSRSGQP